MVLLEGESLLNDAAGLVLFRFAVAAALTGAFSAPHALLSFTSLALGGIAVGLVVGFVVVRLLRALDDDYLVITLSVLAAWIAYIAGDMLEVSGVIATVTCGMVLGWHQHEIFSAAVRTRGTAFWQVIVFVFEALVFVLIGLSLRSVVVRLGGADNALAVLGPAVAAVVVAVVSVALRLGVWHRVDQVDRVPPPDRTRRCGAADWRSATIVSWAGMRGVVTLAIALSLPEAMPGRDLILFAAFAVILVTVLLQGTTIGPLIRWVKPPDSASDATHHLTEMQAWARLEAAQLAAITPLVHGPDGRVIHPRLLEQYTYRARLTQQFQDGTAYPTQERDAHYGVILAAIKAARTEMLCLHRAGLIHDEVLRALERDLDLQEVASRHARG